jgi:hypothetical protein
LSDRRNPIDRVRASVLLTPTATRSNNNAAGRHQLNRSALAATGPAPHDFLRGTATLVRSFRNSRLLSDGDCIVVRMSIARSGSPFVPGAEVRVDAILDPHGRSNQAKPRVNPNVGSGSFASVPRCPGRGRFALNNCRDVAVLRATRCATNASGRSDQLNQTEDSPGLRREVITVVRSRPQNAEENRERRWTCWDQIFQLPCQFSSKATIS